jgi:hypothetical protein
VKLLLYYVIGMLALVLPGHGQTPENLIREQAERVLQNLHVSNYNFVSLAKTNLGVRYVDLSKYQEMILTTDLDSKKYDLAMLQLKSITDVSKHSLIRSAKVKYEIAKDRLSNLRQVKQNGFPPDAGYDIFHLRYSEVDPFGKEHLSFYQLAVATSSHRLVLMKKQVERHKLPVPGFDTTLSAKAIRKLEKKSQRYVDSLFQRVKLVRRFEIVRADEPVTDATTSDLMFTVIEQLPEFPGGEKGLNEYVDKTTRSARGSKRCKGKTVFASFLINEDGSVSDIAIVGGAASECNRIVTDMISGMPLWRRVNSMAVL